MIRLIDVMLGNHHSLILHIICLVGRYGDWLVVRIIIDSVVLVDSVMFIIIE